MLAIIDGDSLIYFSLPKKQDEASTYENCLIELQSRINEILTITKATKYVICITEGRCFRYNRWKFASNYKANRESSKPPMFYALKEYMKQNYNVISQKELEADDLVSIIANECNEPYTVCSIDKDVLGQVEGIHFNYRNKTFVETKKEEIDYNIFKQVLIGDTIDGVYGIRGIGEVTAKKLLENGNYLNVVLEQYIKTYGTHEGLVRFYENYTLIRLLRSFEDVQREVGLKIEMPNFRDVNIYGEYEW
jgi:5'-3' exonuclease